MTNADKYNVVIKDDVVHATVNGQEIVMTYDDFNRFSNMVAHATLSNIGAAFIDDDWNVHSPVIHR